MPSNFAFVSLKKVSCESFKPNFHDAHLYPINLQSERCSSISRWKGWSFSRKRQLNLLVYKTFWIWQIACPKIEISNTYLLPWSPDETFTVLFFSNRCSRQSRCVVIESVNWTKHNSSTAMNIWNGYRRLWSFWPAVQDKTDVLMKMCFTKNFPWYNSPHFMKSEWKRMPKEKDSP